VPTADERLTLLYLIERYPPHVGGAELQAHQVARLLVAKHEVRVVTSRSNSNAAVEMMDEVAVHRIPWLRREGTLAAGCNTASMLAAAGTGRRPDVIQTFQLDRTAVAGAVLAARWHAPLILTVTGRSAIELNAGSLRRRKVDRLIRQASAIVAVSDDIRSICLRAGFPEATMRVIPNGVDTSYFQPPSPAQRAAARTRFGLSDAQFLFIWLGRLHTVKGLDCLLPVWGRVSAARTEARLLIVGEGSNRAAVDALTAAWPGSIRHLPFQQDVRPFLHAADALLMTSRSEGLSCTLIESMAAALPAVVSNIPANAVVGRGCDFMITFDRASPLDVAQALVRAIDRRSRSAELGREARRVAETRHSLTATVTAWDGLYSEISAKGRP
jgi:glycosyltransferase involved in cell wall biosynthesis